MPRPILIAGLSIAVLAAAAPAASARWFPADPIDGPSPDVQALGGIDLARDGAGGVVYIKRDGGVPHVFLARHQGGKWEPPQRVDGGVEAPASDAAIAVADDFRIAVVWVAGGALFGAISTGGDRPQPMGPPALLYQDPAGEVSDPAIDLGINGTAYVTFTAVSDVRAMRVREGRWEHVAASLDIVQGQVAGEGSGASKVVVSAEGNAVAVWGETASDGRRRVYSRRVTGLTPSAAPQELSLADFEGQPGGHADSPSIDIEDDGSFAWVAFRQDFGAASRSVARRLVGSQFEPASAIDGGIASSQPRISMNGRGLGEAVVDVGGQSAGIFLDDKTFLRSARLDSLGSATPSEPRVGTSERRDPNIAVVWRRDAGGGDASVRGRYRDKKSTPFEPEAELSRPELGPVPPGELALAGDRVGNFVAAMMQGPPAKTAATAARTIAVSAYDRPPPRAFPLTTNKFQGRRRPEFRWRAGTELWGDQSYKVFVDGRELGTETGTLLLSPQTLSEGAHSWRVMSIDQRGQTAMSREAFVRVDTRDPRLRVRVSGERKRGRPLRISVRATDARGSGVRRVEVRYGDGTRTGRRSSVHRYGRGKYTLTVRAVDKARNVALKTVRLRIRK